MAPPKDLEEQLGICTDEERKMLEQNMWKSKTDQEKDSEIFLKDLVKKKVKLIYILSQNYWLNE